MLSAVRRCVRTLKDSTTRSMAVNNSVLKCRRKFEIRRLIFVTLFLVYVGVTCMSLIFKSDNLKRATERRMEDSKINSKFGSSRRFKRDASTDNNTLGEGKMVLSF